MSLRWWRYDKASLFSPLDPEQGLERLRDITDPERLFGPNTRDVVARIGNRSFRLRKHQSIGSRNPCLPMLYGVLSDTRIGSRIECRIGPQRLVVALFGVWMLVPWLVFGAWIIDGAVSLDPGAILGAMLGPVATTVFFCLILSFSRWLVRGDARFLLDFLAMALDAREGDDLPRYSLAAAELRSRGR